MLIDGANFDAGVGLGVSSFGLSSLMCVGKGIIGLLFCFVVHAACARLLDFAHLCMLLKCRLCSFVLVSET
jgi:hypothetical protein